MRVHHIAFLSILFIAVSCSSRNSEQEAVPEESEKTASEIMDEKIMEIHDEVMPKMNQLYLEKRRLTQKLDSVSSDQKEKVRVAIQELDSAMDDMNIWMRQYRPDSADVERAKEYFDNQMNKVKKVKDNINKSLQEASKL